MRDVRIVGTGQVAVGEHWNLSIRHLAYEAISAAMADARIEHTDALYLGNMSSGPLSHQENLAVAVADFCGLNGAEAIKTEAACASGAAALRMGYVTVAGGLHDVVVVAGVEKMTDAMAGDVTSALSMAADAEYESTHGVTFTALNALLMQRYMYEFDVPDDGFAGFSVNAHARGADNEFAMFQQPITREEYSRGRVISSPLNVYDSSPVCDGAAALVLVASDAKHTAYGQNGAESVRILGSSVSSDTLALHDRRDPMRLTAVEESAARALEQAGMDARRPDFCELHDAFSILSALSLEAMGFATLGTGWRLAEEGLIGLDGEIPISTQGGLKSRGHPTGATGIYQAVEAVNQLQGLGGRNQVADATVALIQNIGGCGSSVITHILAA